MQGEFKLLTCTDNKLVPRQHTSSIRESLKVDRNSEPLMAQCEISCSGVGVMS